MIMAEEYQVFAGEVPAGQLTVKKQDLRTEFEFRSEGIFDVSRLICVGDSAVASIGIPVPKGGGLYLKRSFSKAALVAMGLGAIRRCLLVPADQDISQYKTAPPAPDVDTEPQPAPVQEPESDPIMPTDDSSDGMNNTSKDANDNMRVLAPSDLPGWYLEPEPERYFEAPELKDACKGLSGVLYSGDGLLAFPWSPEEPFPLLPAFTGGTPSTLGGRNYILYRPGALNPSDKNR